MASFNSVRPRYGLLSVLMSGWLVACAPAKPPILVDLTYPFGEETVYWPTNRHFQWEPTDWGRTEGGYWYASANFSASEHGGTHIDAPIHFGEGRLTVDQIPISELVGPAVVVDARAQCAGNRDYELTVQDLLDWEHRNGRIEPKMLVLLLTGWGDKWPNLRDYLGSQSPADPRSLHFPGFSREAAEFLVAHRDIRGVGIDTASIDPWRSRTFPAHQVVNEANLYALENVAGLKQVPARGATIIALPMKIKGGTGGPVRIIASIP